PPASATACAPRDAARPPARRPGQAPGAADQRHPVGRRLALDPLRPKRGRLGVEAEHDVAAALLYERREPIRERSGSARDYQPLLTAFFSAEPALNRGTLLAAI